MKKAILNFSDGELIEALKKDHVTNMAISYLYRSYYGVLSNHVRQNMGSEQDAEDVFQEVVVTFIGLVKNGKFRGESSVKTFLFTLNRFTWLNELKKRNRAAHREEKFESESESEEGDVSRHLVERESRHMVIAMMDKLGAVCKSILLSYYYDNLSMKEILPLVNFENEQVLRNKKYKCLKSLEQMLTDNPGLAQRFKAALTYGN